MATTDYHTQIAQLYTALFGRAPDSGGLDYWTGRLTGGEALSHVADAMYATDPARAYYPSFLTNGEIVTRFYENVLGREPDSDGLAFWTAKMDKSASPGPVLMEMITTVANYTGTDPAGLLSERLFVNRVTVAQYYAEKGGDVAQSTAILASVTSDPATVVAAFNVIDGVSAPQFVSAAVNGATLVMTYSDPLPLDALHGPAATAFSVSVGGSAREVSSVAVDGTAKTVTLTLASAVAYGQAVTVSYADPTTGNDANAIQDTYGTDAATFAAAAVTNNTPAPTDTAGPVFASGVATGTSVVLTYTDATLLDATNLPSASSFAVTVGGSARTVTAVSVDGAAKTVTLTLASAVLGGQVVQVAYTDPTTGDDTHAVQDIYGNDAATFAATAITNNSGADVTGPLFSSATVNGTHLVMTYLDALPLDMFHPPAPGAFTVKVGGVDRAVTAVDVYSGDGTVTLTLASAVQDGDTVTVAYADPTTGDDAAAIQDYVGNDAASLAATAVTNVTPDTTPPLFAGATVNGSKVVLTYTDTHPLDASNGPVAADFAVNVNSVGRAVTNVVVNASAHTVTLTLASAVSNGQAVVLWYTDPSGGDDAHAIQDIAGNDAVSLVGVSVTNTTAFDGGGGFIF